MSENWHVDKDRMDRGLYWQEALKLVEGCTHVSSGCDHCWSAAETKMRAAHPIKKISTPKQGLTEGACFNGKIRLREDNLDKPLRARKPRVYAVWNDLFHEDVPFEFILKAFDRMQQSPQHTFLVLTKRPQKLLDFCAYYGIGTFNEWPSNIMAGVSVEDQATADERIPLLLQTPAAKRFVSYEPALGPVDFNRFLRSKWECSYCGYRTNKSVGSCNGYCQDSTGASCDALSCPSCKKHHYWSGSMASIDQIIMGGESGPGARPMHPDWARSVRDQCKAAGVAFFFKQWGEWTETQGEPGGDLGGDMRRGKVRIVKADGADNDGHFRQGDVLMRRVGKKAAGALLDDVEHKEIF